MCSAAQKMMGDNLVSLIQLVGQCFARERMLQCRWLGYLFLGSHPGDPGLTSGKAATLFFLFFCIRFVLQHIHVYCIMYLSFLL
jgi:hypothetical protein